MVWFVQGFASSVVTYVGLIVGRLLLLSSQRQHLATNDVTQLLMVYKRLLIAFYI